MKQKSEELPSIINLRKYEMGQDQTSGGVGFIHPKHMQT